MYEGKRIYRGAWRKKRMVQIIAANVKFAVMATLLVAVGLVIGMGMGAVGCL